MFDVACIVLLGFHGYLRPLELCSLRVQDLSFANARQASVNLGFTKSGIRRGAMEVLAIDDPLVIAALWRRCEALQWQPQSFLLSLSLSALRRWFYKAVAFYQLTPLRFTLYSLRRGGATEDFRSSQNLPRVMLKGRWADTATARIYLNE
eukprot:1262284-Amphidinium_carterae.1